MSDTATEWRALVRTPTSILNTPEDRAIGYVEWWSSPRATKSEVLSSDYRTSRIEETHAAVVRWQRSETVRTWVDV